MRRVGVSAIVAVLVSGLLLSGGPAVGAVDPEPCTDYSVALLAEPDVVGNRVRVQYGTTLCPDHSYGTIRIVDVTTGAIRGFRFDAADGGTYRSYITVPGAPGTYALRLEYGPANLPRSVTPFEVTTTEPEPVVITAAAAYEPQSATVWGAVEVAPTVPDAFPDDSSWPPSTSGAVVRVAREGTVLTTATYSNPSTELWLHATAEDDVLEVSYLGNGAYAPASASVVVSTPRLPTELTISSVTPAPGVLHGLLVTGTITGPAGPVADVRFPVSYPQVGSRAARYGDVVTNPDGTETRTWTITFDLPPGDHLLTATFAGDALRRPSTASREVTLPPLELEPFTVSAGVSTAARGVPLTLSTGAVLTVDDFGPGCVYVDLSLTVQSRALGTSEWTDLPATVSGGPAWCTRQLVVAAAATSSQYRVVASGPWYNSFATAPVTVSTASLPERVQLAMTPDFTGDGLADVFAVDAAGRLHVYPGTGRGGLRAPISFGYGWTSMTVLAPGDWNGDGRADLIALDAAGGLYLYPGTGRGSFRARTQIGRGWTGYRLTAVGDMSGDRRADLLAIDSGGRLWLYPGTGTGGFGRRVQVGRGWAHMNLYPSGDLNGDARRDVYAVDASGKLSQYWTRGAAFLNGPFGVARGFAGLTITSGASLTRDQVPDVLGRDAAGRLWLYPGGSHGVPPGPRTLISEGW